MEKYLKLTRSVVVVLGLLFSSLSPIYAADKGTKKIPVGIKLNEVINSFLPKFVKDMNSSITEGPSEKTLKRMGPEDQRIFKALMDGLKQRKARFVAVGNKIEFYSSDGKSTIQLVDYINSKFSVDGKVYSYKKGQSFKANLIAAGELYHKKTSSLFNLLIMDEAYALLPLLAIPGWVWLTGAAAGGVTFFADTAVSAGMNDISNAHPEVRLKITELTETYKERADVCEADLAQAQASATQTRLVSNNTVRMVGALIDGLGAELEHSFLDGNGKRELDYSKFGCEAHDGANGISNRQFIGLWSGFTPQGEILRSLCDHQERLNNCFASTEEVMRENEIRINDLPGPDRIGPYDGLLEDYIQMQEASSR